LEEQKRSAEFSKEDLYGNEADTKEQLKTTTKSEEIETTEKDKGNESGTTSGPVSRHQFQESIAEVDEGDFKQDPTTYIQDIWKKYDNNDILFLDKFETKAFTSELLAKVEENMPSDGDF
jgi:hypothetical protein